MKKYIYILLGIAVVAIVVFQLMSNKSEAAAKIYHTDKNAPIEIGVYRVDSKEVHYETEFSGTFEANREVKINAAIQGKIKEILVDEGATVHKNQALIKLDHSLLKLKLEAIELKIGNSESDVQRFSVLSEAQAIEGVKLEKAQLALASAKIERKILRDKISKSTIRAPFSGVITNQFTEIGAFAAPLRPLLQLTDIERLRFTIFVSEMDVGRFTVGKEYPVIPDSETSLVLQGEITSVGSQSTPAGSYPVKFLITNVSTDKIKSGMFGRVKIKQTSDEKGFYIPATLIRGGEEDPSIYKVQNGKAVLKKVIIKKKVSDKLLISKGVNSDDLLISKGFVNLFDGANVTIMK